MFVMLNECAELRLQMCDFVLPIRAIQNKTKKYAKYIIIAAQIAWNNKPYDSEYDFISTRI